MLFYLHISLEWIVLFLQEGLGLSGFDARSTAYEIRKSEQLTIKFRFSGEASLSLKLFCKSWMHFKRDVQPIGFPGTCVALHPKDACRFVSSSLIHQLSHGQQCARNLFYQGRNKGVTALREQRWLSQSDLLCISTRNGTLGSVGSSLPKCPPFLDRNVCSLSVFPPLTY